MKTYYPIYGYDRLSSRYIRYGTSYEDVPTSSSSLTSWLFIEPLEWVAFWFATFLLFLLRVFWERITGRKLGTR